MTQWEKYITRMSKEGKKIIPGFDIVKPHTSNLYTGLELNRGVSIAAGVAGLAWGAGSTLAGMNLGSKGDATQNVEDVGALPGMSADAVGNATGGSRSLGATGDLVFGMYNARKGR